ncbi:cobyrinate a,c-diamide synthase [Caldivirga maquilingensis]|uniref:Cobyrinate a,c-diamide synthase n=1 Tax=Caldivirga maquilingensis (strain ATCC 700844 / DSM 13496 / JCM 10307 / IC-167) TaxID=397948 RepID=A8MCY3_CALMQ|nr:cobyrinate a,c-diamide synthase [Caldivirga maquilingensis]ABW01639.1 cobyrinic acid a,c-diamide synthase [Caldivirga maquilingensis IC-167]
MMPTGRALLIASDRSGSGKTTVTSIIAAALSSKLKVRAFKVGPDYIDPGYHKVATELPSINLDLWLMGEEKLKETFCRYMRGVDLGLIEGVMGLYDGVEVGSSTFHVAKLLSLPVILVIDCSNISYTAGAIVKGLRDYGPVNVVGVIFNNVASSNHYNACKSSLPKDVVSLGYIPYDAGLIINERHLGLVTVEDYGNKVKGIIKRGVELINGKINLDLIYDLAEPVNCEHVNEQEDYGNKLGVAAVAYDNAFLFYYRASLDLLSSIFDLRFFSPINNEVVNNASFIYIGGGYPELHLRELEAARDTASWLRKAAYDGVPILAECGGLMYLSKYIRDDREYSMVGLFDIGIAAKDRLTIGYTELESIVDNPLVPAGLRIRGHEFHVSRAEYSNERYVFRNIRGRGIMNSYDGVLLNNALGLYTHTYLPSIPGVRDRIINIGKHLR